MMDIGNVILQILEKKGEVRVSDVVQLTGFSRAYINRFFKHLREEGRIALIGKANKARYISATHEAISSAKKDITNIHRILRNENLAEHQVFDEIKDNSGIFSNIAENVNHILHYAFTEMLNNAIEHSRSEKIEVFMKRHKDKIRFEVIDKGIGIFNSIMQKKQLKNEMEAIDELLKGKFSTMPERHTGEGIFFTSKVGDLLIIQGSRKKILFDNLLNEVFIRDIKNTVGTRVMFVIGLDSMRRIDEVFKKYTDDSFEFSKTAVSVRLYEMGPDYISRSQARRIMTGIDRFKTVILDFKDIETIGQGFADEVFQVWQSQHPDITIIPQNANENVCFMISRARSIRRE
ncbi:MAG: DUF4325 domain-containing protein [Candidatus Omnitrophica bacterium]|nr:DUF4325 domain-containing protein [Candidatus Omnitrophota bacterium]